MAAEESALVENETGQAPLLRRLGAEFLGALLLVAVGAGALTVLRIGSFTRFDVLQPIPDPAPPGAAEQNAFFEAILGNTFGDILGVAFAFSVVLAVLVYVFGGVSGGHFNPAVTFALAVVRRFSWTEVPGYWLAQIAGGIAGAFVIAGIYGELGASIGNGDILFGATVVAENIDQWQAILAEAFITFILMTAIMGVAIDPRAPKGWSGLIIGLALGGGILVTDTATGGSANFARSLGPFVASQFGPGSVSDIPWGDLIVYAVGPLVGAAAAALVYESVSGLEPVAPAPKPGAATGGGDGLEGVSYTSPYTSGTPESPAPEPPAPEPPAGAPGEEP